MSDEHVKNGERRAEQIQAATWYVDEYIGTVIYARNPFGSGNDFKVADIRGWGHLTGQGALRMDPSAAEITQMALATHIVNCHNNRADLAAEREQQLVEALRMAEGHLEEMRKDPRHHPIGHCPILDRVRDTLAAHEHKEGEGDG